MTTTSPLRGLALGNAVIDLLTSRPELHNQDDVMYLNGEPQDDGHIDEGTDYRCGSVGCIAGWIIALAHGADPDDEEQENVVSVVDRNRFTDSICSNVAALLGVDGIKFSGSVFVNSSTDQALANLRRLLDKTYSTA